MSDAALLVLTLGLAICADTDDDYGRLCWKLQRGEVLWPGDSDRLYAHEWIASRVRKIDSEALARQSLEKEGIVKTYPPGFWDEPCFDCGSMDCDGLCALKPDPPYCVLCGGECTGWHNDEEENAQ